MNLDDITLEFHLKEYILRKIEIFIARFQIKPRYVLISRDVYAELNTNKKYHIVNDGFYAPNEYTKDMKGDKLLGLTVCLTTDARKKIIKLLADY
jgi:hypothetical protein